MDHYQTDRRPASSHHTSNVRRNTGFLILALVSIILGTAGAFFVPPVYLIAGVVAIMAATLILRYPFFGFVTYMIIYFLRIGERLPFLAPLRVELVFGILLIIILIISDIINKRAKISFPTDRLTYSLILMVAVMSLSFVFSEWHTASYEAILEFIKTLVLFYCIVVLLTDRKRFLTTFWLLALFTAFVGIEATINYHLGNYSVSQGIMRAGGATSYGEHPNSLAMYMASAIPLFIYLMAETRSLWLRFISVVIIGLCVYTMILTGSRSGLLMLIAEVLIYIWFFRQRIVAFIIFIALASLIWVVMPQQYQDRYSSILDEEVDASSQGRLNAWKAGVEMFLDRPFLGVGPGVFAPAYFNRKGVYLSSHSMYVEAIATMGLLGTMAWIFFFIRLIQRARSLLKNDDYGGGIINQELSHVCITIIGGLLIAGIFGHILLRDTWFITAGLLIAGAEINISTKPANRGLE